MLKTSRRIFVPLFAILIVAAIVLITSGRGQTPSDPVAEQPDDPPVPKSALQLFGDYPEAELRIVDFKPLSSDHMLISVNDMLYLLDANKKIVWETYIDMVAPPIVDSTGAIYGIRQDVGQFSVNAYTGEVSVFGRDIAGTHAGYTQIKPYKDNQYLIVENRQFYRDGNLCYPQCPMANDGLFAWSGQTLLWSTDFPPNAKLEVWGDKILAVTKRKNSVVVEEVKPPTSQDNP